MASREEIERLRQLARQRHRAATQKASRLRAKGVDITGTKHDPRRDLANLKKYNTKQLEAYIGQLNNFTSRQTSWVPGQGGHTLLTGQLYNRFESLKRQVNKKRAAPYETVKDIQIPTYNNMTVAQLQGQTPDHPTMQSPSSRAPHLPVTATNKGIRNDKQLKKNVKRLEKELSADYGDKVIARDQKVMRKFFKDIAKVNPSAEVKKLRKDFWDLSSDQFAFLWNYTRFAEAASGDYETAKAHMHDPKGLGDKAEQFNTQIRHMQDLVNDVKTMRFDKK